MEEDLPVDSVVTDLENPKVQYIQETASTEMQIETELECQPYFVNIPALRQSQIQDLRNTGLIPKDENDTLDTCLLREKHKEYLSQVWKKPLRSGFISLDSSRPWILYWCLHGYDLISDELPEDSICLEMVKAIESCWYETAVDLGSMALFDFVNLEEDALLRNHGSRDDDGKFFAGGFGGGFGQMAHAATNYAAVLSLCIIGSATEETHLASSRMAALALLQRVRKLLYPWFLSLQMPNGGYRMHHDGEVDVRSTYTILCCAKLLNICSSNLCHDGVTGFVAACQTFEGGIGGEPFSEAHGGYAYCGLAALKLVDRTDVLDMDAMRGWLVRRQMSYEGGFCGRTNKLVDGCYSFWQGGALAICSALFSKENAKGGDSWLDSDENRELLFDAPMLERYILLCAQDVNGGLRDKPSKSRDFYHSCYNLSGLSVAQHNTLSTESHFGHERLAKVHRTHPCYNIRIERSKAILAYFSNLTLESD